MTVELVTLLQPRAVFTRCLHSANWDPGGLYSLSLSLSPALSFYLRSAYLFIRLTLLLSLSLSLPLLLFFYLSAGFIPPLSPPVGGWLADELNLVYSRGGMMVMNCDTGSWDAHAEIKQSETKTRLDTRGGGAASSRCIIALIKTRHAFWCTIKY